MLVDLTREERKKLYKLVSAEDFKKSAQTKDYKITAVEYKKIFDKYEKSIKKEDLDNYVELHHGITSDKAVHIYLDIIFRTIQNKCKKLRPLIKMVSDYEYQELVEKIKDDRQAYEEAFSKEDFTFEFDTLLMLLSKANKDNLDRFAKEKTNEIINKCLEKNKELEEENKELARKLSNQEQENKKLEKSNKKIIQEYEAKLEKLNKKYTCNLVSKQISKVIGEKITGKDYDEVYKELERLEIEAIDKNDYEKLKYILASKFTLIEYKERQGNK